MGHSGETMTRKQAEQHAAHVLATEPAMRELHDKLNAASQLPWPQSGQAHDALMAAHQEDGLWSRYIGEIDDPPIDNPPGWDNAAFNDHFSR